MSDVIVDIVETGNTLRENHLEVLDSFKPISARMIVNKSSFKFRTGEISQMADKLREVLA